MNTQDSKSESFNPYATSDASFAAFEQPRRHSTVSTSDASLGKTIGVWTLVCSVSAMPSFYWGYGVTQGNVAGMGLGVLIFIVMYVIADIQTRHTRLRNNPIVRRTLLIGYWTRMVVSIIFPVGLAVDMFAGMVSLSICRMGPERLFGPEQMNHSFGFLQVTWTTLVTGVVVNLFVFAYMLIVYAALYCFWRQKLQTGEVEEVDYS